MNSFEDLLKYTIYMTIKQGVPSVSEDGSICCYRAGNLKCAVGHLIADIAYSEHLEDLTVSNIAVQKALERSTGLVLNLEQETILRKLQYIHDGASNSPDFVCNFKDRIGSNVSIGTLPEYALEALEDDYVPPEIHFNT